MDEDTHLFGFDGITRPIALVGCANLLELFPKVIQGWHYSPQNAASTSPVITLRKQNNSYSLEAAWLKNPIYSNSSIDIICAFIAELSQANLQSNPHQLCLHAASAEFSERLVVFPNKYRTGKSLLSACLAAQGIRIFSDDVLPIDMNQGFAQALGFQPRLRLPLPNDLTSTTLKFLHDHQGPVNNHYSYLNFSVKELAPKGVEASIGAFVILKRRKKVKAQLRTIPAHLVLRDVIWQNFSRGPHSAEILQRLYSIVAKTQCQRLTYAHAEDAVTVLMNHFTCWPSYEELPAVLTTSITKFTDSTQNRKPLLGHYMRHPQVQEITLNGNRFLTNPKGDAIYYLNQMGSSIWKLLEEPMLFDEMTGVLHDAFPEIAKEKICADVTGMIKSLVDRQLLYQST